MTQCEVATSSIELFLPFKVIREAHYFYLKTRWAVMRICCDISLKSVEWRGFIGCSIN